jgi:hypothetical protein
MKTSQLQVGKYYLVCGCGERCLLVDLAGSATRPHSVLHKFINEHDQPRFAISRFVAREVPAPVTAKGGANGTR